MDEFRWIQMFLCLMLMIQIADDQNNCDGTTWIFGSRNKPTVELITLGQIGEGAKNQSDRLSVTANCSLDIKKLRVEDVGRYYCQQYKVGQTPHTQVHQSLVHLSVIALTEHKDNNKVILNCSVLAYETCHHTVKWMIKGQDVDKDNNQMKISQTDCSTTVTFPDSHYLYSSRDNTVKYEVTDTNTGRVQLFTFSPQPSGEETGNTKTTKKQSRKTESSTTSVPTLMTANDPSDWRVILGYVTGAAVLVLLLITVVIVIRWKKTKGNKTQRDKNAGLTLNPAETQSAPQASQDLVDPEVSYATISYTKNTNSKIRVRDDDDGDTVTYSTVKAPATSAAATTDPNNLYSAVSFPVT
ncbi:uncharacterized protein LOC115774713 isoform X2 [Archocentrus centrarchus]|uniref:uncharacterized protein LOC115774713 isoform X2 n=1 Tax=Archocentrus centrarchus TaxID=63155 RepID=UPI0011E9BAFE|nr:uncharacterized protein LOC115774713 isoform X2 [Archocentrus centrarchus]